MKPLTIGHSLLVSVLVVFGMSIGESVNAASATTTYKTVKVNGLDIFYREAGAKSAPTILLLHGYPTSSHMFRNLMRDLSDQFHLLAPDYPGYGRSEQPPMSEFDYTFENMSKIMDGFLEALDVEKFSIYLMDYGAPIGYRIAAKYPERVETLIVQNGNAYEEGLKEFWDPIKKYWNDKTVENGKALGGFHSPEGLKWQYTHGVRDVEKISPDNWNLDLQHLNRPENNEIQLAMFYDYRTNVPLYPEWQEYFRKYQPPTLIIWGKNDHIFPADGAHPYKRDLKDLEFHLLDTGHFALEEDGQVMAEYIRDFEEIEKRHKVGTGILHMGAANVPAVGDNRLTMNGKEGARLTETLNLKYAFPAHFEGWLHYKEGRERKQERDVRILAVAIARENRELVQHLRERAREGST